jgi:hypothetical protein
MQNLPPELEMFSPILEGLGEDVQHTFIYCLSRILTEAGEMKVVLRQPGTGGDLYVFESKSGGRFQVMRPPMTAEQEKSLMDRLVKIIKNTKWT